MIKFIKHRVSANNTFKVKCNGFLVAYQTEAAFSGSNRHPNNVPGALFNTVKSQGR